MENAAGDRSELLSALNTEYFVLQGASASSISEASSRASLYLLTLSSGLVSVGFALGLAPEVFTMFAGTVLTTVFVLGWFTVFRLIDTSVANVQALRGMVRIRRFYRGVHPLAGEFFPTSGSEASDASHMLAIRRPGRSFYSTMASMIGAVNGVVGGAAAAMLAAIVSPNQVAITTGLAVAASLFIIVMFVQRRRFAAEFISGGQKGTTDY